MELTRALRTRSGRGMRALAAALLLIGYGALAGSYHARMLEEHGTLTGMQEAVANRAAGHDTRDLLAAAKGLTLRRMGELAYLDALHVGGWAFLKTPRWTRYAYLALGACTAGLFLAAFARAAPRRRLRRLLAAGWPLWLFLALTWLALTYHALHSHLRWGIVTTNAWYGVAAFPALFALLLSGANAWGRRVLFATWLLFAFFLSGAYWWGTCIQLPTHQAEILAWAKDTGYAFAENRHVWLSGGWGWIIPEVLALIAAVGLARRLRSEESQKTP